MMLHEVLHTARSAEESIALCRQHPDRLIWGQDDGDQAIGIPAWDLPTRAFR